MGHKNVINHIEFRTKDKNRLKSFYSDLFSWKFQDLGDGYTTIDTGAKEAGGGIIQTGENEPAGVLNYISVDDLDGYEAKVKAKGGHVKMSKIEVPGMGHFSIFTDVDNNTLALWQNVEVAKKKAKKAEKKAAKAEKKAHKAEKKAAKAQKKAAKAEKKAAKKEAKVAKKAAKKADKKAKPAQ
jgi:predicted enzyme related to lactoylglutathione lyase